MSDVDSNSREEMSDRNAHENLGTFRPRTLRLSNSFSGVGTYQRRRDNSITIQKWKESFTTGSMNLFHFPEENDPYNKAASSHLNRSSMFVKQTNPSRRPSYRIRTRSIDRKSGEGPDNKTHRNMASESSFSAHSSRRPSSEDEGSRKPFQIPIQRSALSVLPRPKASSQSSVDDNVSTTQASEASQQCSSFALASGTSAQSTLATSVDSNPTNTRSNYQPRPLLLATFGAQNRVKGPSGKTCVPTLSSQLGHSVAGMRSPALSPLSRNRIAETRLEQSRQVRQQKLIAKEAKQKAKKAKEAELTAISSHINGRGGMTDIKEADEEDCWSWLSGSDAEEEFDEGEEEEDMAVVWRASLDVGRRVPKDRKALGKGHGIRVSSRRDKSLGSSLDPSHSRSSSSAKASGLGWISTRENILRSIPLVNLFLYVKRLLGKNFKPQTSGAFLFGSGIIGGIFTSMAYSALANQLPILLVSTAIPKSNGLGLILHLTFPQRSFGPGAISNVGYLLGGVGLGTSW